MREDVTRKKVCIRSRKNHTAREKETFTGGDYFCDYSPRYTDAYSIYEKAKSHARQQKKENRKNFKKVVDKG